jgi:hypothetical protein
MKTAYDLLMTAPDDQIVRMRLAWKAIADGDWIEAEAKLRNAALESEGQFSVDCLSLADHCKAQVADSTH